MGGTLTASAGIGLPVNTPGDFVARAVGPEQDGGSKLQGSWSNSSDFSIVLSCGTMNRDGQRDALGRTLKWKSCV